MKSVRCRARKTILSPALISPDNVHRRKATLRGIDVQGAPECQFAKLVLQRMAAAAERHGITI